jgi:hypothetical protein
LFVWLLGKANKANKWTLLALTTCEVACLWEPLAQTPVANHARWSDEADAAFDSHKPRK